MLLALVERLGVVIETTLSSEDSDRWCLTFVKINVNLYLNNKTYYKSILRFNNR